jgi:hypothetical protein
MTWPSNSSPGGSRRQGRPNTGVGTLRIAGGNAANMGSYDTRSSVWRNTVETNRNAVLIARAEALFNSAVPTGTSLGRGELDRLIRTAVRAHGGVHGCAVRMAWAYGEAPETAARRMTWARRMIADAYRPPGDPPGISRRRDGLVETS